MTPCCWLGGKTEFDRERRAWNCGQFKSAVDEIEHSGMRSLLSSTVRYIRLAFSGAGTSNEAQRRYVRIVQAVSTGLAGRGVAVLVSFISIPLTVRYLGAERYGVWVTISTAIAWMALADFGLSSSLTNVVSEGYAKGRRDVTQDYVASAFWSLVVVMAVLSLVFFLVWPSVSWDRVFNVQSAVAREEVGTAVAVAFAIFALNFPLSVVARVYGAYQELAVANAWSAAGNLLGLAALLVVTRLKGGLAALVIAVSGATLLVNVISSVWLFAHSKPWLAPRPRCVKWHAIQRLGSLGGMFFVIQIAGLVFFQTDNLIIAHYLGAASVTPYSVTWRLFTYTTLFQILANPSFWPAYAEAFSRGDGNWVRRSFALNFKFTVGSTVALALPLVFIGRWIIREWAGAVAVPPSALLISMAVWSVVYAATSSQSCILAASGRLRGQMIYSGAGAAANIPVSIFLVQRIGATGAVLGTISAYLTCILVPQWFEVDRALRSGDATSVKPTLVRNGI